ncbi:unnamed protein product [Schistocephalus solidus]|uniref:Uncharacterized protein n=1 Tax=Schistocephalus solidus TaxID=70667 RepID=A0A183TKF9_SCHSO|nr:unnamed protein product [Schistocephalus solidus]
MSSVLIWEARCHATRESKTRSFNGFPKPARPSADCRPPWGIVTVFNEHQTEDVQGRRLDDTPVQNGDLNGLLEPNQFPKTWHLKTLSCLAMTTCHNLLVADDCALNIAREADMKRIMTLFAAACAHFGLTIKPDKTVVLHLLLSIVEYNCSRIIAHDTQLQMLEKCVF